MQLSRTALRPLGAGFAAALVTAALVTVAPAATAAPTLTFTAAAPDAEPAVPAAQEITVEVGETVSLDWDVTSTDTLDATGDGWSTAGLDAGPKSLEGPETFVPTAPATLGFTLTATDADDLAVPTATQTVTVTVIEPAGEGDTVVTPEPVVQDGCSFVIPDVEGVDYLADVFGEVEPLEPGTDPTFIFEEETVVITAEAQDGFTLADDAVTEFAIEIGEECEVGSAELVTATPTCKAVTFANISDTTVALGYGSLGALEEDDVDGELSLEPGESQRISTDRAQLIFVAFDEAFLEDDFDDEDFGEIPAFQIDQVDVPQNCSAGGGAEFPTTAPAAGR